MKKYLKSLIFITLAIIIIWLLILWEYKFNYINIETSITTYPLAKNLIKDINSNSKITMVSTSETFEDLVSGKADIIFVTIPNNEQQNLLNNSEWDFELVPISTESVVILINKDNPLEDISSNDLRNIYTSNHNRNEFWWDNNPINSYQISLDNWSATIFSRIMRWNSINEQHIQTPYMDDLIDKLWNDKYWIGYAFYTFSTQMYKNDNLKIITLDNKSYNDENYLLKSDVFVWYNKSKINKSTLRFIQGIFN